MDPDELDSMAVMGQAIATIALQNSVDAINAVFGEGSAKVDTPLVAAAFAAQSQFLATLITAASQSLREDEDDDDFGFALDS
jgi:hypothetical protein